MGGRIGFAIVLALAMWLHWEFAGKRDGRLLEHDEAITLLAAAGKSDRIDALYASLDRVNEMPASELQALLKPTGDTGFGDVWNSVVSRDVHPPLYFWLLHGVQRISNASPKTLRAIGFLAMLAAAIIADRFVWPGASLTARLAAFGMLIAGPVWLDLATELRQYSLVAMGTMITLAALAQLQRGRPRWCMAALLGAGCAGLIWTHLGSAAWSCVALGMAMWIAGRSEWKKTAPFWLSTAAIVLAVIPLATADWNTVVTGRAAASDATLASTASQVMSVSRSVRQAFLPLPYRFDGAAVNIGFTVVLTGMVVWLAQRGDAFDRAMTMGAGVWTAAWLGLLALGKIPEHAAEPKYLAPLLLSMLAILVRSTAKGNRTATGTIMIGCLLSPVGWYQQTMREPDDELASAVTTTTPLLVDEPKRGHLLPIVDRMDPDARIFIAAPTVAVETWQGWKERLPDNGLLVLELGRPDPARVELKRRLLNRYVLDEEIWRGPARTLTKFSVRRNWPNR